MTDSRKLIYSVEWVIINRWGQWRSEKCARWSVWARWGALLQDVGGGSCARRATPNLNQPQIMRGALGQLCHKTEGYTRIKESTAEFRSRLTGVCCVKKRGGDGKDTLRTTQSGVSERSSSCTIRLIVKLSPLREVSNVSNVPLLFITIKLKRWFCCLRAVWCWQQRSAGPPAVLWWWWWWWWWCLSVTSAMVAAQYVLTSDLRGGQRC